MNRFATIAGAISLLALGACNGASNPASPATSTPLPAPRPESPPSVEAAALLPIRDQFAGPKLMMFEGDRTSVPEAAWQNKVVTRSRPAELHGVLPAFVYALWDPASGASTPLWQTPEGMQDLIASQEGDWLAITRAGFSLPFADWTLMLRNVRTGELRTIAEADPAVLRTPGLRPVLPTGFGPAPSMSSGRVVWVETIVDRETGLPAERVQMYTMATDQTVTLMRNEQAGTARMYSPAIGGGRLAWAEWDTIDGPYHIFIRDLTSGDTSEVTDVGQVFDVRLTSDGEFLVWSATKTTVGINLKSGKRTTIVEGHLGTDISGHFVSWWTATGHGNPVEGGYHDLDTGITRTVTAQRGGILNVARVMGPYFVWQDYNYDKKAEGAYYFLPLGAP